MLNFSANVIYNNVPDIQYMFLKYDCFNQIMMMSINQLNFNDMFTEIFFNDRCPLVTFFRESCQFK